MYYFEVLEALFWGWEAYLVAWKLYVRAKAYIQYIAILKEKKKFN